MVTVHVLVPMQTSAKGVERGKEDLVQAEGQALESRESGRTGRAGRRRGWIMDHGSWYRLGD